MSSATGGRAPLLSREEGSSLAVGTTPGGGASLGPPGWATHSQITHERGRRGDPPDNVPAAKSKLSVETPSLALANPCVGLCTPCNHSAIRKSHNSCASVCPRSLFYGPSPGRPG